MTTIAEQYDDGILSNMTQEKSDMPSDNQVSSRQPYHEPTNRTYEPPASNHSSRYTMQTAQLKHDYGNNVVLLPKEHDMKTRPANMRIQENHVVLSLIHI